jgi:hypothetical protein
LIKDGYAIIFSKSFEKYNEMYHNRFLRINDKYGIHDIKAVRKIYNGLDVGCLAIKYKRSKTKLDLIWKWGLSKFI